MAAAAGREAVVEAALAVDEYSAAVGGSGVVGAEVGWAVVEAAVDGYSASVAEVGWDVAFTVRRAVSASGAVAVAVLALDSAVGPGGVEAGAADEASLRGAVAGSDSSFRAEVGGVVSACVGLSVAVAAPNAPVVSFGVCSAGVEASLTEAGGAVDAGADVEGWVGAAEDWSTAREKDEDVSP